MNTELSAKKILQQYHNAFYKLFHVPLDWIDQRNRTFTLCSNEHCHPLCRKIMEHRHGRESCEKLTSERIQRCRSSRTFGTLRNHFDVAGNWSGNPSTAHRLQNGSRWLIWRTGFHIGTHCHGACFRPVGAAKKRNVSSYNALLWHNRPYLSKRLPFSGSLWGNSAGNSDSKECAAAFCGHRSRGIRSRCHL